MPPHTRHAPVAPVLPSTSRLGRRAGDAAACRVAVAAVALSSASDAVSVAAVAHAKQPHPPVPAQRLQGVSSPRTVAATAVPAKRATAPPTTQSCRVATSGRARGGRGCVWEELRGGRCVWAALPGVRPPILRPIPAPVTWCWTERAACSAVWGRESAWSLQRDEAAPAKRARRKACVFVSSLQLPHTQKNGGPSAWSPALPLPPASRAREGRHHHTRAPALLSVHPPPSSLFSFPMSLNTIEAAKQAARQALAVAGDKYRLATATLTRAETQVRGGRAFCSERPGSMGVRAGAVPGKRPAFVRPFSARLARDQTAQRDDCRRVGVGGSHQAKSASWQHMRFPSVASFQHLPTHTPSSPHQDLDVAIIKATTPATHVVPKDKHVRILRSAVGAGAPRAQVAYVNGELLARLRGAAGWLVSFVFMCAGVGCVFSVSFLRFSHPPSPPPPQTALKTLMVFHRLMRECDASYLDELLKLSTVVAVGGGGGSPSAARVAAATRGRGGSRFGMDAWVDTATIDGKFEFSEYVRGLARYLDAALGAHEAINWCPCADGGGGDGGGFGGGGGAPTAPSSRFASLATPDLLHQLPVLQRLLLRLADCAPAGPAAADAVVQASLLSVVKESFRAYRAASEGLINLADRFFDMDAADAAGALDAYRQAGLVTARLQAFYRAAEALPGLRGGVQFPRLEPPPADFVRQMEEYAASAPRALDVGGGAAPASAPAPAPPQGPAVPLRRGRLAGSRPAPASLNGGGFATAVPVPAAPVAAAAAAAPPGMDLLGELASLEATTAAAAPAPAPTAAFDPFALGGDVPLAPPPVQAAAVAAAAPTASPPPPRSPQRNNPFADDPPPPFPPPAASAPPATPAGVAGAGRFWGGGGGGGTPPSVGGVASAPAAPPPPLAAAADPFADLMAGGLSLGPGPRATPPLKAMAPPAGRPMSADKK